MAKPSAMQASTCGANALSGWRDNSMPPFSPMASNR